MMLSEMLEFKGKWRNYQARVLDRANKYLSDGKIHIVAAPGSGKTTLGIELIRRLSKPALILAPSVTIREQWISRIVSGFLKNGYDPNEFFSQDLKNPKLITVATYQALHSAVTLSYFDVVKTMKSVNLSVLCLDECHHLRSEWWKALEDFKARLGVLTMISLTATPPYDSTPSMWSRYMDMCGEIDIEITIPELVKEGSLCPHQDFVYFSYPTKEESEEVENFNRSSAAMIQKLVADRQFAETIASFNGFTDARSGDELLDKPEYLSSLLIYMRAAGLQYPVKLQRLLSTKKLPALSAVWMERMLQGFCYEDTESFQCNKEYRDSIIVDLKAAGLIEKRKVVLRVSKEIERLLSQSKGKCNSIRDITFHEYHTIGKELRMLILTDYIKKEYEKTVGKQDGDVVALGVIPIFELLRRENVKRGQDMSLGVLSGTIAVIPAKAKDALLHIIKGQGEVKFSRIGDLSEQDYLKVDAVGDAHFLTAAITEIFTQGWFEVLIGTKSLLGEGWDSPCINSLILASFVGSFMLSNQMRGRAIRVFKDRTEKTSNIWHLVCLQPERQEKKQQNEDEDEEISGDFSLLSRRMEHFLGLHYFENRIESGMERLAIIAAPFNNKHVEEMNTQMLQLSDQRQVLKSRWDNALVNFRNMEVIEESEVTAKAITSVQFKSKLLKFTAIFIILITIVALLIIAPGMVKEKLVKKLLLGAGVISVLLEIWKLPELLLMRSPLGRLKVFGKGLRSAMMKKELFEDTNNRIRVRESGKSATLCLTGGTTKDKEMFAQCVTDFFAYVDNQRYLLVKSGNHNGLDGFFCVPEIFGKNKDDAELFTSSMKPFIGKYNLVYTRNEEGRKFLLKGRVKAFANREERCVNRKRVKDDYE